MNVIDNHKKLDINDEELKKIFFDALLGLEACFRKSERLYKDFEEIFTKDIFDNLKIEYVDKDEFFKRHPNDQRATGCFVYPKSHGEPCEIHVRDKNIDTISHELVHYIKYYIELKYGIEDCPKWIDEPLTEYVSSNATGRIYGYYHAAKFAKTFIEEFQGFTLEDFFYDNMNEYRRHNPIFSELRYVFDDFNEKNYRDVSKRYAKVIEYILNLKINECINENTKLLHVLEEISKKDISNKFSEEYNDDATITNAYVRGIRKFCEINGYNLIGEKNQLEKIINLVNEYRMSKYISQKDSSFIGSIATIKIGSDQFYFSTKGIDVDKYLDGVMKESSFSLNYGYKVTLDSADSWGCSVDYSIKKGFVVVKYPSKEISFTINLLTNEVTNLVAKNPDEVKVVFCRKPEDIIVDLKNELEKSLIEEDYTNEVNNFLIRKDRANFEIGNEKSNNLINELNMAADFLGSEIMICQKDGVLTTMDPMDPGAAAISGLHYPKSNNDIVDRFKKIDENILMDVVKKQDLKNLEQFCIMLKTADGKLIDAGVVECIGKDKSLEIIINRKNIFNYFNDDMKKKIFDENNIHRQPKSKINTKIY
jgi:hypothetical protein